MHLTLYFILTTLITWVNALPPQPYYTGPSELPKDFFNNIPGITEKSAAVIRGEYHRQHGRTEKDIRHHIAADPETTQLIIHKEQEDLQAWLEGKIRDSQQRAAKQTNTQVPEDTIIPRLIDLVPARELSSDVATVDGLLEHARALQADMRARGCRAEERAREYAQEVEDCWRREEELAKLVSSLESRIARLQASPSNDETPKSPNQPNEFTMQAISLRRAFQSFADNARSSLDQMWSYLSRGRIEQHSHFGNTIPKSRPRFTRPL